LFQNGTEIANGVLDNNYLTFDFDSNVLIAKGSDKSFSITADIGGRSADTIKLYLDNNADLRAVGQTYGFNVAVTRGAYDNGSADGTDASWTTVQGGQLTVAFNGPASTTISPNQKDVVLYKFSMTAGNNVEVRKMDVKLDAGNIV
jgi:hypothetical protein